jgi:tetratricopeptide (TPR) repeat protein/predicted Ser/Thr protein kinase
MRIRASEEPIDPLNAVEAEDICGRFSSLGEGISRFSLHKQIGHGSSGVVFKAYDHELQTVIALKILHPGEVNTDELLRREVAIAQTVNHPAIVRIHDLVQLQGETCISMEYVDGPTLASILLDQQKLSFETLRSYMLDICDGISHAHKAGIAHCDLKPANIIVQNGRARIADFGLAINLHAPSAPGIHRGTPAYMSPEQRQGLPIDGRTDLYSLGLILFECAVGRLPTKDELTLDNCRNLRLSLHDVPRALRTAILRCLRYSPSDRYPDAKEIMNDLQGHDLFARIPPRLRTWTAGFCFILLASGALGVRAFTSARTKSIQSLVLLPIDSMAELRPDAEAMYESIALQLVSAGGAQRWMLPIGISMYIAPTTVMHADVIVGVKLEAADRQVIAKVSITANNRQSPYVRWLSATSVIELQSKVWSVVRAQLGDHNTESDGYRPYTGMNDESYRLYSRANDTISWRKSSTKELLVAISELEAVMKQSPSCSICYLRRAKAEWLISLASEEPKWRNKSLADVNHALAVDDGSDPVLLLSADMLQRLKRPAESISILRHSEHGLLNSGEGKALMGRLLADDGASYYAVGELQTAIELNPLDVGSLNKLGLMQTSLGDYEQAISSFKRILAFDPNNGIAWNNVANAYLREGRFHDAIEPLERAVKEHPSAPAYSNLGMAMCYAGDCAIGLPFFEKAVQLAPTSEEYVGSLAHAYRWLKMPTEANRAYKQALELATQESATAPSAQLWADLGLYYAALKNKSQFLSNLARARDQDAANLDVSYKEAVGYALLGEREYAKALVKRIGRLGFPLAVAKQNPDFATLNDR